MGNADIVIGAKGLSKRFGKKVAVDSLSFEVPAGSVCGFLGPNGAGKTTTIRMLMGLIPATSGSLKVLDLEPMRSSFELRQRTGYVPERHRIYQWMTVPQVLRFAGNIYPTWDWKECERMVGLLGLPTRRKVKELSRGELAKLALTVALAHRPRLLILDEPTTGLDPLVRQEFLDVVLHLARQEGRTVFFSTHILSDVDRVADRIVVIDAGKVLVQGTVEELRSRYTKASFVFARPPAEDLVIPGALRVQRGIREWVAVFDAADARGLAQIRESIGAVDVLTQTMTVEDVFLEAVGNHSRRGA